MDGYSVWDEASRDYDSEARLVAQANLRVASTGVMQYLALAQTNDEFEGRLMLATASIQELSDSTGVPLDEVTASLRNRWQMLVEAGWKNDVRLAPPGSKPTPKLTDQEKKDRDKLLGVGDIWSDSDQDPTDESRAVQERNRTHERSIRHLRPTEETSNNNTETEQPNESRKPVTMRSIWDEDDTDNSTTASRKTASDGQCQNAGCEENAGIGGSYCDRCSMLTNASRKTAVENEDHHINDAMYHLIEDHDNGPGDILSQVHADASYRARHGGHTDVGELLKEKHENEHASNIDHSHSSDEEDNPILQIDFDDDYKDTTASRRTAGDDGTCNCPCGCENPLEFGGQCGDCGEDDHQNNNNLSQYTSSRRTAAGNVRKRNGMWVIIDKKSGNVLSSHQTRDEAVAASKRLHSDYKSLKVSSQSSNRLNFNKTAGADDCSEDHAISETYGDEPTEPQLAIYKKNNVSPSDHQELTDFFGVHAHKDIMNHVHRNSPSGYYNPEWGWQRTHRFSSFDPQIENDMG